MPNLMKIKKIFPTGTKICDSISGVPTKDQLLGEKSTCTKFQIDISKAEGLVCLLTNVQKDE